MAKLLLALIDDQDAAGEMRDCNVDLDKLRRSFVKNAKAYGAAKGIEHATWREIGVPTDVLRDAGITRGR